MFSCWEELEMVPLRNTQLQKPWLSIFLMFRQSDRVGELSDLEVSYSIGTPLYYNHQLK